LPRRDQLDDPGKRLELLLELVPQASVIALLVNPTSPIAEGTIREVQEAARAKGRQLHILKTGTESEIDGAFATLLQLSVGTLVVAADAFLFSRRDQLVALAARNRVPAIYTRREWAKAGGLISYGASATAIFRLAGASCWPDTRGCEAGRSAGPATDHIRAGHQSGPLGPVVAWRRKVSERKRVRTMLPKANT
jgi:hypothetical protein